MSSEAPYPQVPSSPRFSQLEEEILASWDSEDTFRGSVEAREGASDFVFYDGPPFANGLPHYGHLLTSFVKDVIPRYQTMRGHRVARRWGWDCHGLPAEVEVEKQLGVSGRGPITEYGIDRFNDACRSSVMRYTDEWRAYVTRMARWVDFDSSYKTMDLDFMESVIWAFKQLYDKGLMYEAYRVLPYCWECETPLSNSETRTDDAYRDRQDPAVTVAFTLTEGDSAGLPGDTGPLELWSWTTTPWTLPSNLALAVGRDIEYSVFRLENGRRAVVGEARVAAYAAQLENATRLGGVKGSDLVGRRYTPLFSYFADWPNSFRVLAEDFVSTEDGTGIVQMAPGFGEDDQVACAAAGIEVVCPVDDRTRFTSEVPDFEGLQVFEANQPVIRVGRAEGWLVRGDSYVHSYPHCWRTDTPLVYKAVTSWFVDVQAIKEQMLANNTQINWVPGHVKDGSFGRWLANERDWSISRNRFWGSPIPVWKSDDPAYPRMDVYGSLDELERDFGVRPSDLHRPGIDQLTRPNPDDPTGRSTMRRVTDVLDCWFDSGSMSYAQVHYPFDNQDWFEHNFPGDFIVEYIGQTRGWFNSMHVLATALFDRPAFKNVIAHGIVLGDDGRKMSKRLRNFPDPEEMFAKHGADAVRWYLMSSPVLRGGDSTTSEKGITDAVRSALLPLWNTWYFFSLYSNAEGHKAALGRTDASGTLDRYLLAKTATLVEQVTEAFDAYDIAGATKAIESYLDALTNWYVRRSRDRFWATGTDASEADTLDAFDTLGTCLEILCRVAAPLLPMLTESVWRPLTGEDSVHLTDWPQLSELPADPELVSAMDRVRDACSAAHSVRKARRLRARLPLRSMTVVGADVERLRPFADLIADEVNVKEVLFSPDVSEYAERSLSIVFKVAAPRLGSATQAVAKAAKAGDWQINDDGTATVGGALVQPEEFELKVVPKAPDSSRTLPGREGLVVLDTDLDHNLLAEGTARDVVRLVQTARRDADLAVTDRIRLVVTAQPGVVQQLRGWEEWIAGQTLASAIRIVEAGPEDEADSEAGTPLTAELPDGGQVTIQIAAP